jgi:SAM-dependent methyltransferase
MQGDLADPQWAEELPSPFERVFAFAVLHHVPSEPLRVQLLNTIRDLLASDGRLVLSVWNFLASERLRERIVPWEVVEIRREDVDPGDYLVDWRHRGRGLRYVHFFSPEELSGLAAQAGYEVQETYFSDGEGGRLGHYQVWVKGG